MSGNMSLLFNMTLHTLRNPREAGARVITLEFPLQVLWIALGLGSLLMSLTASSLSHVAPLPSDETGDLIRMMPYYRTPLVFAILSWVQAVFTVFALFWVGRSFGGQGRLTDIITVMVWLQVVSLILAVSLLVVALVIPVLGVFLILLAFFWGLWATVALVDAAHRFGSYVKTLFVCIVVVVAITVIGSIVSGFIGLIT